MITPIRAVPGPRFTAGCTISTWMHTGERLGMPLGYLLIGYGPPELPNESPDSIEDGLMGMVAAMGMRPVVEQVPECGPRLIMNGPITSFDYGHPEWTLRLPHPGAIWRAHVSAGRPVCVMIGLDPLQTGTSAQCVSAYLERACSKGRVYMGAATLRRF
ncbi:hypothetical protein [Streptomyces sp. NPDC007094]|uniref:hypothetical protein n=1 Tax=Streptomyces sp. NPDC007094 TaxID=3155359 RepID=UPI0033D323E3